MSFDEQPDEDYKWDIHYHDYSTEHKVRVIAHCKHCARCRFERKNTDCVVLAVAPVADEQPDGDIHADDPASYSAEGEEFPPVPTQLLWMFDGIDRKEATKMMHDYAASAIAWKPSAALRTAWERAQQAEDKARRLEDSLDACRPYLKEGETAADALKRLSERRTVRSLCEAYEAFVMR